MLKKLTTWLIAVVFIFQTFVLVSPAQASPISPLNSRLLATLSNNSEIDNLEFSDTNRFYQDLAEALKSNKEVKISTNYKSYADLPPKLKNIFKVDEAELRFPNEINTTPLPSFSPLFLYAYDSSPTYRNVPQVRTEMPATINYHAYALLLGGIAVGATTGAGIGTFFGGIGVVPGALGGGLFGLVSGVVAEAFNNPDHKAIITFDPTKGLIIVIQPA